MGMLQAKHTDFWKSDSWYIWDTEKWEYGWWIEDKKWFKERWLEFKKARMWWTPHCYATESYLMSLWISIT